MGIQGLVLNKNRILGYVPDSNLVPRHVYQQSFNLNFNNMCKITSAWSKMCYPYKMHFIYKHMKYVYWRVYEQNSLFPQCELHLSKYEYLRARCRYQEQ